MGTAAARITAADFLTPPELRDRALAPYAAGRIGGARLELTPGPAGTGLGECYQQIPLRVLPPFRFGTGRPSLLYLLNPTAGLLEGDGQLVEVTARAGSRAVLAGQSATRIHPCPRGYSCQRWRVHVEAGAVLVVLPGPAIPFRGCRYFQAVDVDLEPGAGFVWGDVWLAGRYARGKQSELFQFASLVQDFQVRRGGKLVFRDRFGWHGPWDAAAAAWHFGDHPVAGSLFVTGAVADALAEAAEAAPARFTTAAGDTVLRWCGPSEAVTAGLVHCALRAAAGLAGAAADDWLFRDRLAAGHWFSPGLYSGPQPAGKN